MADGGGNLATMYLGFGIAGLITGPFMFWCGLDALKDERRSKRIARDSTSWPVVYGIVTKSEIRETVGDDSANMYLADLIYEYEVEGQRQQSSSINAATIPHGSTPEGAARILESYPVGTQVAVFFNPRRPGESVLQPGLEAAAFGLAVNAGCGPGLIGFGALCTILGMVGVVLYLLKGRDLP